jgi:hypothetical protein
MTVDQRILDEIVRRDVDAAQPDQIILARAAGLLVAPIHL